MSLSVSLFSVVLAVALAPCNSARAQQQPQQEKPASQQEITIEGIGTIRVTTIKASVEAVDQQKRTVTLKGPRGNVLTLPVSERVKNLPQVNPGDIVQVAYFEAVAVDAKKTDAPLAASETVEEDSAAPGEKPAGVVVRKVHAIAEVLDVNNESQSIRVRGPRGNVAEVKVRDPKVVSSLKAGDKIDLTYVEGVAIEVRESTAAE